MIGLALATGLWLSIILFLLVLLGDVWYKNHRPPPSGGNTYYTPSNWRAYSRSRK